MKNKVILILIIVVALCSIGLIYCFFSGSNQNKYQKLSSETLSLVDEDYKSFSKLYSNIGWMGEGNEAYKFELTEGKIDATLQQAEFRDGDIDPQFRQAWAQENNQFQEYWRNLGENYEWKSGVFPLDERYIYIYDSEAKVFYLYIAKS